MFTIPSKQPKNRHIDNSYGCVLGLLSFYTEAGLLDGKQTCTDAEQNEMGAFVKGLREAMVELEAKVILFRALLPSKFTLAPQGLSFSRNFLLTEPRFFSRNPHLPVKTHISQNCQVARVPQLLGSLDAQMPPSSHGTPSLSNPFFHLPQGPSISSLSNGAR